jgi:oxalate decarboxylase
MARLVLSTIIATLAIFLGLCNGSPVTSSPETRVLNEGSSSLKPLHFARRDAAGYRTRHLRPEDYIPKAKRDGIVAPDVGQMATFTSGEPEPTRLALGATFLSNSNHVIDDQNVDNVAGPTTDAGTCGAVEVSCVMLM